MTKANISDAKFITCTAKLSNIFTTNKLESCYINNRYQQLTALIKPT